jgi:hypothetical protein
MSKLVRSRKARLATVLATAAVSIGIAAAPASAQPVAQEGLVNVAVTDLTLQIPIGVAANVCGVTAAVLADQITTDDVECTALGEADAFSMGTGGGGPVSQTGLVNVAVTDAVVQVPVALAANICGVGVAVLADDVNTTDIACEARSRGRAQN